MKQSLFRTIRRKLLNEGKLLRYITYAIGEVVLIIVGILFALKINDWNEDRKAQAEFDEYIVQLKEDVRSVIDSLNESVIGSKRRVIERHKVLQFLENPSDEEADIAIFEDALEKLGLYATPQVHVGLLGTLLNGDLEIIKRRKLVFQQVLQMQSSIQANLEILDRIDDLMVSGKSTLDKYRGAGTPTVSGIPVVPEMRLEYDLGELVGSSEFSYAAHNVLNLTGAIGNTAYHMVRVLEDFLAVLEEYE